MKTKEEIINTAIDELQRLTGEDFHGYRSEVWNVIYCAIREQELNTHHAVAEAIAEFQRRFGL